MSIPSVNPAFLFSPIEDGYVAYDPISDHLHRLNAIAALVIELTDGDRSIEQINEIVSPMLPPESIGEIDKWIKEATEAGLLFIDADEVFKSSMKVMGAAELCELSEKLSDEGKTQTAYICLKKAAELAPEDADVLSSLGNYAQIVGKREEACKAFESYLNLEPDDAEIRHILTSLKDEEAPARVPNECIKQLYHRFSSFYEDNMLDELEYQGPSELLKQIETVIGDRKDLSVIDLGCGTGLAGEKIKPFTKKLIGIDLSPEMVEVAGKQDFYDHLEVCEVTEWLHKTKEMFDLIMACDTYIYFGDLRQTIEPSLKLLNENGVIAFSVERADEPPYQLTDSGRYVHHIDHIQEIADELNLNLKYHEEFLRMEYGVEVIALFVTLTRK